MTVSLSGAFNRSVEISSSVTGLPRNSQSLVWANRLPQWVSGFSSSHSAVRDRVA
jgi:hypothetical protein